MRTLLIVLLGVTGSAALVALGWQIGLHQAVNKEMRPVPMSIPDPLPELHGSFSLRDVEEIVARIRPTSTSRIVRIDDEIITISAYAGPEWGGIVYLFRRENDHLVPVGAGDWDGRPRHVWSRKASLDFDLPEPGWITGN